MIDGKREWVEVEAYPLPAPLPAMLEDLDDAPRYVLRRYIVEQAWEIEQLRAQLAEARALLISGWTPADDMGRPCLDWVKRRNALLAGRSE